jgi:hypothetical protein
MHLPVLLFLWNPCSHPVFAQNCPVSAATAKYWQYRERFNRHFIVTDRNPSGCINDGIGQNADDPCKCTKEGYGLPGTAIKIEPNGNYGLGIRNERFLDDDETIPNWEYDPACSGGTSWQNNAKHNFLDMGSETPTQVGWNMVALSTEFELLKKNGQTAEAQRVLEEIFLSLQAMRRLDIQLQCLAKRRYDQMKASGQTELLCHSPYTSREHPHFDTEIDTAACNFVPRTDGFGDFFLREDATQALEPILHDSTEGKYNIDMIKSDFSFTRKPPCETNFIEMRYLYMRQNFMSQDQLTGIMLGLAFIKRYVSATDSVTTCDGRKFSVLSPAQRLARSYINNMDDGDGHLAWPGARDCLHKTAKLSMSEGGNLTYTARGLRGSLAYITGNASDRFSRNSEWEWIKWRMLQTQTDVNRRELGNVNFWLTLTAIKGDLGQSSGNEVGIFYQGVNKTNKQLYPLINNLLHPGGTDIPVDKAYLENLLCSAPCEGSCSKKPDYDAVRAQQPSAWPAFECPNTPGWTGQRWDGTGQDINDQKWSNHIGNGLDYMVLHNMYLLKYHPNEAFYNPARFNANAMGVSPNRYNGDDFIQGPGLICPGVSAQYKVLPTYGPDSLMSNYTWSSSGNISLSGTSGMATSATINSTANQSFIEIKFQENRQLPQRYNGNVVQPLRMSTDRCYSTYRKPINTRSVNYDIAPDIQHCFWIHEVSVEPVPVDTNVKVEWTIRNLETNQVLTERGYRCIYSTIIDPSAVSGTVRIKMKVTDHCGQTEKEHEYPYSCDNGGGRENLILVPNPTTDVCSITFPPTAISACGGEPFAGTGVSVYIYPATSFIPAMVTNINSNGGTIHLNQLPNGAYRVVSRLCNSSLPIGSVLIISRL